MWEIAVVALIIGIALFFTGRSLVRTLRGKGPEGGGACGGCGGCPSASICSEPGDQQKEETASSTD